VFVLDPLPNLIFTRDPFASIQGGVSIHKMATVTRSRETIFADYIFNYNDEYKDTPKYYGRDYPTSIEGGDVMILRPDAIAVGISVRTNPKSLEALAENLFANSTVETVYGVDIPKGRA
jgi:arginine deiminase